MFRFIVLLLFFLFLLTKSLLVPYAYVSSESIDCILLPSFELIILISSVKKLRSEFLNLCCVFNIDFFFMNLLWSFWRLCASISFFSIWFISFTSWVTSDQFLQLSNLSFLFMTHFYVSFAFLSSLPWPIT